MDQNHKLLDLRGEELTIRFHIRSWAMYTPVHVNVPLNQHDKLKDAITKNKPISLRLRKDDLKADGKYMLLLAHSQLAKIQCARLIDRGITIRLSRKQVEDNVQH